MKKIYFLLVVLLSLSVGLNAQIFIEEAFDDTSIPDGWSLDGSANQWGISGSIYAGGEAPEARFTHINTTNTSRFISPEVDLTGFSSVMLSFKHKLFDNLGTGYSVGIATRSGGGAWNIAWEVFPNENIGPEGKVVAINNSDVGQSDFQFCFVVDGNLNAISYWYMDDVKLFVPLEIDAEMIEITTSNSVYNAAEVTGTIKNVGVVDITELEIRWKITGGSIHSTTFSDLSVVSAESYDFVCDDLFFFAPDDYVLEVWIQKVNGVSDGNPDDNLATKEITVVENLNVYRVPFFEEFTSSTCAPCAGFNSGFVPWCADHESEIALLKYQMNWPGAGDPYYTGEGGVRRTYYGVSGVPDLFGNGDDVATSVPAVNNWFNTVSQLPGYINIAGAYSLTGTVMEINANILPYQDFSNITLYVAVFEYETVENVATNGETEFENVMMKMVPDASGTSINLVTDELYEFSQSVDLAGTNVEEWDDLGVVFFIQQGGTKDIHQAAYGIEDYTYSSDARLNEIRVNNIPIVDFDPDVNEYNVELAEGETTIAPVTAFPYAGSPTITYEYPDEVPGSVIITVRAEDLSTTSTYTVNLTLYTGIEDSFVQNVQIYPNPTTGIVSISGVDDAVISVYDISGRLINSLVNGNIIDLSSQSNGIYLIKIQKDEAIAIKKISLNK